MSCVRQRARRPLAQGTLSHVCQDMRMPAATYVECPPHHLGPLAGAGGLPAHCGYSGPPLCGPCFSTPPSLELSFTEQLVCFSFSSTLKEGRGNWLGVRPFEPLRQSAASCTARCCTACAPFLPAIRLQLPSQQVGTSHPVLLPAACQPPACVLFGRSCQCTWVHSQLLAYPQHPLVPTLCRHAVAAYSMRAHNTGSTEPGRRHPCFPQALLHPALQPALCAHGDALTVVTPGGAPPLASWWDWQSAVCAPQQGGCCPRLRLLTRTVNWPERCSGWPWATLRQPCFLEN